MKLTQRRFCTFQLSNLKDGNPARFVLAATWNCWGYLIFKNKKSFQSSILNEAKQSHIRSLIPPWCSLGSYSEQQIKARALWGHPPNLLLLGCCAVLCSNMPPAENKDKYEGEIVAQYGKKVQRLSNSEDDLFNQRFA